MVINCYWRNWQLKALFQDKFQWRSSILATQHSDLDFTAYLTLCSLYIFLFLYTDIVFIRRSLLQIFFCLEEIFCFFIISNSQIDSESREQFSVFTLSFRSELAVVCIYCFSVVVTETQCENSEWMFFSKRFLKNQFLKIYTGLHSLDSSNGHVAFQKHFTILLVVSIPTLSSKAPINLNSLSCLLFP